MSRQYTQILKGFAIIMMVWLHLFGKLPEAVEYSDITFGGTTLSFLVARLCNPVGMFLALGGYGLYCVYSKGNDKHHVSRIIRLYEHYWVILAVFVTIGTIMGRHYLTDWRTVMYNVSGLQTHWNYECWFLLPYSLLSLSYPLVFKTMDRFSPWWVVTFTFVLSIMAMTVIHFTVGRDLPILLSLFVALMEFLFCFCCGALAKEYCIVERLRTCLSMWGGV